MVFRLIVLLAVTLSFVNALPSYITQCSLSDPNLGKCATKSGNAALPTILKGDKKLRIPNLTPLIVPLVLVESGDSLKIKFTDVKTYDLPNIKIQDMNIDDKAKHWTISATVDVLEITGDYDMKGRISVLPINGNGRANVTYTDAGISYDMQYKEVEKGGSTHLEIVESKLDITSTRVYIHFDNLFNGDNRLGEEMNKFIDENWQDFAAELKPAVVKTVVGVVDNIFKGVFSSLSKDEIFRP